MVRVLSQWHITRAVVHSKIVVAFISAVCLTALETDVVDVAYIQGASSASKVHCSPG